MYISICICIYTCIYICCNMHTCTCVKNNLRTMKPCSCRIFQLLALKFSSKRPLPFDLQQLGWWWMVDVNNPSLSIVGYRIPIFFIVESSIDDLISLFKFLPISLRKGNLGHPIFAPPPAAWTARRPIEQVSPLLLPGTGRTGRSSWDKNDKSCGFIMQFHHVKRKKNNETAKHAKR